MTDDSIIKEWFETNYGYMGRTWADLSEESKRSMRQMWKYADWLRKFREHRAQEKIVILWYPGLIQKEFTGWCDG